MKNSLLTRRSTRIVFSGVAALGLTFMPLVAVSANTAKEPTIALSPSWGPIDTVVTISGKDFPPNEILIIRFDGVMITAIGFGSWAAVWSDENGTPSPNNFKIFIPSKIKKTDYSKPWLGEQEKLTLPGPHSIEVFTGTNAHSTASATFTVGDTDPKIGKTDDKKQIEEPPKKDDKKIDDDKKIEVPKKIIEKKKETKITPKPIIEKKKTDKDNEKQNDIARSPCDPILPLVWQPGCIQEAPHAVVSPYADKPCSSETAITFQPGCISQPKPEIEKPYAGKPCDPNLPLIWQEACVQQKTQIKETTHGKIDCSQIPSYSWPQECRVQ